jgi:biopolymer transport protein TolR
MNASVERGELLPALVVYMDMQAGQSGSIQSEINMTPMIDVLLVLIIIFMVIAPVRTKGLEAVAPQDATERQVSDDSAVVIEIAADGSLRLNRSAMREDELARRLRLVAPRPVFVQGARELEYQVVARVIDVARGSGIGQVRLLSGSSASSPDAR